MHNTLVTDVVIWWVFALITGLYVGTKKGYNKGSIFFLLFLAGPLAAIPIYVLPPNQEKLDNDAVNNGTKKYCPFCVTVIPIEAIRCPRCTSNLTEEKQPDDAPIPCLPQPKEPTKGPIEKKVQREVTALRVALGTLVLLGIASLCQVTLSLT